MAAKEFVFDKDTKIVEVPCWCGGRVKWINTCNKVEIGTANWCPRDKTNKEKIKSQEKFVWQVVNHQILLFCE